MKVTRSRSYSPISRQQADLGRIVVEGKSGGMHDEKHGRRLDHLLPLRALKSNWPRDGRAGTRPPKLPTNALITLDAHSIAHAAADAQRSETFFGVAHFGRAHQHTVAR